MDDKEQLIQDILKDKPWAGDTEDFLRFMRKYALTIPTFLVFVFSNVSPFYWVWAVLIALLCDLYIQKKAWDLHLSDEHFVRMMLTERKTSSFMFTKKVRGWLYFFYLAIPVLVIIFNGYLECVVIYFLNCLTAQSGSCHAFPIPFYNNCSLCYSSENDVACAIIAEYSFLFFFIIAFPIFYFLSRNYPLSRITSDKKKLWMRAFTRTRSIKNPEHKFILMMTISGHLLIVFLILQNITFDEIKEPDKHYFFLNFIRVFGLYALAYLSVVLYSGLKGEVIFYRYRDRIENLMDTKHLQSYWS